MSSQKCPLCGGRTTAAFSVNDRNRGLSADRFHYRRCRDCRTIFLSHPPDDLSRFYPDDYYRMPSAAEFDAAVDAEASKLALVTSFVRGGALVEIGPAWGSFSRTAALAGFDVTAVEMDLRCCEYLRTVVGVRAIHSATPEQVLAELDRPVHAVVLWHVLEHLRRPWALLEQAARQLAPGGVLILATPNPQALQFRLLGRRWAHVDAPRHLFLIPFDAVHSQAQKLGLTVGLVTTSDPAGRHWNVFGWEYALRRHPARRPSTAATRVGSRVLTRLLRPVEGRGLNGAAYTVVLVRPDVDGRP